MNRLSYLHRLVAAVLIPLQAIVCAPVSVLAQAPAAAPQQLRNLKDAYQEPWTPPAPVLTSPDLKPNEAPAIAEAAERVGADTLSAKPDVQELKRARILRAPVVVDDEKQLGDPERAALSSKLSAYARDGGQFNPANARLLDEQIAAFPESPLRGTLLLEKALLSRRNGHFIKAEEAFAAVWAENKNRVDLEGKRLAEKALDDLIRLSAALGRKEALAALVTELEGRDLGGAAAEALRKAKEALWFFKNRAEHNVFCGFSAANSVCVPLGERPIFPDVHDAEEKKTFIRDGLSLFELAAHSAEAGGSLRVVKRAANAPLVVPSVVHWKFNHYSAITERNGDRYRVKDTHLGFDGWITAEALEEQLSGYLLVPGKGRLPAGYAAVPEAEAKIVFGRHCVHARDDEGDDCGKGGDDEDCAMTTYSFRLLKPGLVLRDTPLSHTPPFGPSVNVQLRYDQRSTAAAIPDSADYANFGPRWTHGLHSFVEKMGSGAVTVPNTQARVVRGNGAYYDYSYNSSTASYSTKAANRPQLVFVPGAVNVRGYKLIYQDGGEELFTKADGSSGEARYFLTRITDPQGKFLTYAYDGSLRLTTITDAVGGITTFSYTPQAGDGVAGDTLKIRSITDPFSRVSRFNYDSLGRLRKITDALGIISEFRYGKNDFIEQLTTPYGATLFRSGSLPGINAEPGFFVEAVDPAGDIERAEANDFAFPQYPDTLPFKMADDETGGTNGNLPPTSISVAGQAVSFLPKTENMQFRNTFYWDKEQMGHYPGDYSKATIYNFLTVGGSVGGENTITSVLASVKKPLEGRVWFNYPKQTSAHSIGQTDRPSKIVRAVEKPDGTTGWGMEQVLFAQPEDADPNGIVNPNGLPVGRIDEEGRRLRYRYAANNLDLEGVDVKDGATWRTLAAFSNYSAHLPQTVTDGSGLVTQYLYNASGQISQMTLSKGGNSEVTKFTYKLAPGVDAFVDGAGDASGGYLMRVERTAPGGGFVVVADFSYDAAKRIRRAKDTDGYILVYDYDNFDRVTLTTHPDASTEQFVYDRLDLQAVKDRGGLWSRTFYNALRQPVVFQNPKGQVTALEWCRCGDVRKLIDPTGKTTWWKRDAQGRVYEKLLPDGSSKILFSYQPRSGRLASVTTPVDVAGAQPTVNYAYNLAGQVLSEAYADAGTPDVGYTYNDFLARLTQHADGIGVTGYGYQPLDGNTSGGSGLTSVNGPRADDTLRYSYDWQNRLTQRELLADSGAVLRSEQVQFDSLGRLASLVSGLGSFDYIYNASNNGPRLDAIAGPNGMRTDFSYYPLGTAGAKALRLSGMSNTRSGAGLSSFSYDYDTSGRITTWGRTLGGIASTWSFEYSRASELTGGTLKNASAQVIKSMRYLYDGSGNRLIKGEDSNSEYARYNQLDQLQTIGGKGAALVEGTVDEPSTVSVNGQRTETVQLPGTSTYRFERQIEANEGTNTVSIVATDARNNTRNDRWSFTVGPVQKALGYDLNGNLLNDGTRTFTWDAKNRLKSATVAGVTYSWEYDGLDHRIRESRNGTLAKEWIWDGSEIIQERNSDGTVAKTVFSNGVISGGTSYYYTTDHLGSVREMVDGGGAVRARYDYDLYGQRAKISGDLDADFGYTGFYLHAEIGIYLAPFRAYDPVLGRWLSRDLLGEFVNTNLYSYLANPLSDTDSLGLCSDKALNPADAASYVGQQLGDAGVERENYVKATSSLDRSDKTGRTALKQTSRANTPPLARGIVETARPSLEPRPGSGLSANVSSGTWNAVGQAFKWGGRALVAAAVLGDAYDVASANGLRCKSKALLEAGFGTLGALGGGTLGAAGGSLLAPGPGTVAGGIGGGIAGGYGGRRFGSYLHGLLWD